MLSRTRSVTLGDVSRGKMSSAVTSIADAGFAVSTSADDVWAAADADDDDVTGGLCLLLVVGIIIGVTPSSSSSRIELVYIYQPNTHHGSN